MHIFFANGILLHGKKFATGSRPLLTSGQKLLYSVLRWCTQQRMAAKVAMVYSRHDAPAPVPQHLSHNRYRMFSNDTGPFLVIITIHVASKFWITYNYTAAAAVLLFPVCTLCTHNKGTITVAAAAKGWSFIFQ